MVSACLNQQRHASCNFSWDPPLLKVARIDPISVTALLPLFGQRDYWEGSQVYFGVQQMQSPFVFTFWGQVCPLKISFSSRVAIPGYGSQLPSAPVFTPPNANNQTFPVRAPNSNQHRIDLTIFNRHGHMAHIMA